ncbi:hypothetical protein [Gilvimarinus sp. 1_MG-2023]|uniref:hypothetical protein n=1 Tax=Gilvimarinus sp. 1_MG-2023 TaxID=3062638 RepID=UPI0026E423B6|nr:hypothetical protein [Gilvimarinus sp. 1_MG-2023]MDO6745754.1 hypothetical protein [Gilvimarinus sp. 1_MG-2023]
MAITLLLDELLTGTLLILDDNALLLDTLALESLDRLLLRAELDSTELDCTELDDPTLDCNELNCVELVWIELDEVDPTGGAPPSLPPPQAANTRVVNINSDFIFILESRSRSIQISQSEIEQHIRYRQS